MKTKEAIIIILAVTISNTVLCQDTAHTRLVDKYYPKSEVTPEPQNTTPDLKLAPISRSQPLNNSASSQKPIIKNEPVSRPVVPQATVAAEPEPMPEPENTVVNNPSPEPTPATPPLPAVVTSTPYANPVYRDTRLGSSAPQYDTYKKNDNGAGAITTDPNKRGGGAIANQNNANTESSAATNASGNGPIYRNNRLGSSSPLYNTYEKNDYGAGSVTTSPK